MLDTEKISYAMSLAVSTIHEYEQWVGYYHPELEPPKVAEMGAIPWKRAIEQVINWAY